MGQFCVFDTFYAIFDPFWSILGPNWTLLGKIRILQFPNFGQLGTGFSYRKSGDGKLFFEIMERPARDPKKNFKIFCSTPIHFRMVLDGFSGIYDIY